ADVDESIDELGATVIATTVADLLVERAGGLPTEHLVDLQAVELAREYLAAHAADQTPASRLGQGAGTDRFTPPRPLRRAPGTPPARSRLRRRLAPARRAMEGGRPLARAAADAGFADQTHLTRQFKRSYGLTPAVWARVVSRDGRAPSA